MSSNFAVEAIAMNNAKNSYPISSDGIVEKTGGFEYISPNQTVAASTTLTYILPAGLEGLFYLEIVGGGLGYSFASIGQMNSSIASIGGFTSGPFAVTGGTITITVGFQAGPPSTCSINLVVSAGVSVTPQLRIQLNKIGSLY
jgi:hypothetical protein